MSKQTHILLLLFIVLDGLIFTHGQNVKNFNEYNNADYVLVIVPDRNISNPGDNINIKIYFKGRGLIDENYLHVYIPNSLFADSIEVSGFDFVSIEDFSIPTVNQKIFQQNGNFQIPLNRSYFRKYSKNLIYAEADIADSMGRKFPPININFNIDEYAYPGEYNLNFAFIYTKKGNVDIIEKNTKLTVLSFGEKHQNWLSVIIALLSGLFFYFIDKEQIRGRRFWLSIIPVLLTILILVLILPNFSIWGLLRF